MQEVAPRAVRIADAMLAISCTINLIVSFFVIHVLLSFFSFLSLFSLSPGAAASHGDWHNCDISDVTGCLSPV